MQKHTPGPWWWEDWDTDNGPNKRSLVARPETKPSGGTAMFPDLPNRILKDEDGDCLPANKALIAAAPEMLTACEYALSIAEGRLLGTWDDVMIVMRDVVAKARGEVTP